MTSEAVVESDAPARQDEGPTRRERLRRYRPDLRDVLVLAGFGVLSMLLFRNAWRSPTTTWIGEAGDPPFIMWQLRWLPNALLDGQNPLYTRHLNYPDGVNLMWNTSIPLLSFLLAPLTLTVGPIFAYNVLMTSAVALSGGCAYLMLRRYVTSRAAAIAGGLLYGFSPYIWSHAREHPSLTVAFVPPLLFLLLDEILVRQKRPPVATGLVLGVLAFVQLMIGEEMLVSEFLVAGVGLVLLMILHPSKVRAHARHAATALAVAAAASLALGAAPLLFQFFGPRAVRSGAVWGPDIFVSDLVGFVIPTDHLRFNAPWTAEVTGKFSDACCPSEWSAYLGLPLIVLLIALTARLWSKPLVRLAGLLAAAAAILSMGPRLHVGGLVTPMWLPFDWVTKVPVVENMLAERLMLYVFLMAAILVAVGMDRLLREGRRPDLALALAAVALVPLVPNLTFPATATSTPAFFQSNAVRQIPEGSVVLVAPFARDTQTSGPMLWQAEAGMHYRMPSGYILGPDRERRITYLPIPTRLSTTMEEIQRGAPPPPLTSELRAALVGDLVRADVQTVIVGPMGNREAMVAFFDGLLRSRPVSLGGVFMWKDVDPARLR